MDFLTYICCRQYESAQVVSVESLRSPVLCGVPPRMVDVPIMCVVNSSGAAIIDPIVVTPPSGVRSDGFGVVFDNPISVIPVYGSDGFGVIFDAPAVTAKVEKPVFGCPGFGDSVGVGSDGFGVVFADASVASQATTPVSFKLSFIKDKVLRTHRGRRGGYYVQVKCQYNSITGIDVPMYQEILSLVKIWAFGKSMNESLKCRVVNVLTDALFKLKIVLPASQKLLLLNQIWVDLTSSYGIEDHANTYMHEQRELYHAKSRGGHLEDSWWTTWAGKAKRFFTLGYSAKVTPGGLPRV